ncbi:hypothetical protein SAMN05216378_1626 [Paenibacillus catalpae]|uniref:Uncharacterized protein n=1 Tax=Paenibacillus catalpae TaxID=1045775 RepID=A0A1I1VPR5_9BACL|nr:hypothetical protein [Paenibacillus catalpae]SFD83023.1 hypothetical protein SAMN05216378_1626 [Paenibacillus catalpae]
MTILAVFVATVLGLLLMAGLDVLVFKQPFVRVFVDLLPVFPDTSTVFMFAAAFVMAAWVDFKMTDRLKKKFGKQSNKQGSEENRDAKQS